MEGYDSGAGEEKGTSSIYGVARLLVRRRSRLTPIAHFKRCSWKPYNMVRALINLALGLTLFSINVSAQFNQRCNAVSPL